MLAPGKPQLGPITADDVDAVGEFLCTHLNPGVPPDAWARAVRTSWAADAPNHGFQLTLGGRIVGAYLALYSTRRIDGTDERFCNLAAWCVLEDYRSQGLRLLRALLAQRGYTFTDLSPSGNVVALNERLGFTHLDTSTAILPAIPWRRPGVGVSSDPVVIDRVVTGREAEIRRDHLRAAAALHVVVTEGDRWCFVILRRERRKGVRGFASLLHVSDPDLLRRNLRPLAWHLLRTQGVGALLVERRLVGDVPRASIPLTRSRPKMFRSDHLRPDQIDYLYSELTCVAW